MNLTYHDQLEIEKADARNTVEEYVYSMRDKLDYDLNDYITEADKEVFKAVLTSTEDWLYEEGEDQPKKVYVDKAAELKKLGDPVVLREQEWRERPPAFEELGKMIVHYEKILKKYGDGVSQPKNNATHKCICSLSLFSRKLFGEKLSQFCIFSFIHETSTFIHL